MTSEWVMRLHADVWRPHIGRQAAQDVIERYSGSYAVVDPTTGVKIISINTMYAYKSNFWLYDSDRFQPDPNGLLEFLVKELQAAEDVGQLVWIIGKSSSCQSVRHENLQQSRSCVSRQIRLFTRVVRCL